MRKTFSFLLVITSLMVVSLIAGMMLPAQIKIESVIEIKSTAKKVYAQLNDYKNRVNWSSWSNKDKDITYRFEGSQYGTGAIMHWQSQLNDIGKGSQKIIEIKPDLYVKNIVAIQGLPRAYSVFTLDDQGGKVKVSWAFEMQLGYNIPARIKALFMKDDIERYHRESLANLKEKLE
ncbi:MAG: hypothetical protein GXP13_08095 [Gammaproteobacteria bacterium]|nr:hypothetical protein [Gammaproteobacteria bacterium]